MDYPSDQGDQRKHHEIQEELEERGISITGKRLVDFIPIYISTFEKGLIHEPPREKRFLDFLKAHPSRDWFFKLGFTGRLAPFSFFRRSDGSSRPGGPPPSAAATATATAGGRNRRRFRVPFVRKINWNAVFNYSKKWIKNPVNLAFLLWLIACGVCLIILVLLLSGLLNHEIPKRRMRKRYAEILNQILNALFTIMSLYHHPKLFHHLILLLRWRSSDAAELRKAYCKNGTARPHEWAHMMFVVILLHITCFSQYALCGLYWGYNRKYRPGYAENLCIGVGIGAPAIAAVYIIFGPLGKKRSDPDTDDSITAAVVTPFEDDSRKRGRRRVVVTRPEWVGGLFDFRDDAVVASTSFFCPFCVFGWNMERLGFGNMYVHIVTFLLLILAPFWVFNIAALNIQDGMIREVVQITGIVLGVLGLLYGGFWRIQMRKRFKLPGSRGFPNVSDCVKWLFCWPCALAQEVRTVNFYDVEEDSFYSKQSSLEDGEEEGSGVLLRPLRREGFGSWRIVRAGGDVGKSPLRSLSCPSKVGDPVFFVPSKLIAEEEERERRIRGGRDAEDGTVMVAPVPPLMQVEKS